MARAMLVSTAVCLEGSCCKKSAWLAAAWRSGRISSERGVDVGVGVRGLLLRGVSSPGGRESASMCDSSSDEDRDAVVGIPWCPSTTSLEALFAGVISRLLSVPSSQRTVSSGNGNGMRELSNSPWAVDLSSLICGDVSARAVISAQGSS